MHKIEMPTMYTMFKARGSYKHLTKVRRLKIPGGWTASIPTIVELDKQAEIAYSRFFQSQGMVDYRARQEVLTRMNDVFMKAWLRNLGISLRYWARKYANRFPDTIQEDGTLQGFDPQSLQYMYVPGTNKGRKGISYANDLFAKMYKDK